VPIAQASQRNSDVQVPNEEQLSKMPHASRSDQHLSEAEEQELWRHYGLNYDTGYADRAASAGDRGCRVDLLR
jgi:hypothetical protein